ncbi:transposase DDE domain protein, partial [Bacteroides fragilis str. 3998 T(B) 4]
RLIVERAFSIRENYRRLAIDCEFLTQTAEAMVGIAFIQIVLKRFF